MDKRDFKMELVVLSSTNLYYPWIRLQSGTTGKDGSRSGYMGGVAAPLKSSVQLACRSDRARPFVPCYTATCDVLFSFMTVIPQSVALISSLSVTVCVSVCLFVCLSICLPVAVIEPAPLFPVIRPLVMYYSLL